MNALQQAIRCCFIKFCIYCFSLWYGFFVHCALRVEKNYQHGLDAGPLEFQFLRLRGCLAFPFRTVSLCFGVMGKHQVSSAVIISLHVFCASAIEIMSWQDVTRSSLCPGVKTCGTKCAHNFLFPKSSSRIRRTTVFGMFKDSAIIIDAIRQFFFTKSATAAMFTSVWVDFGRPPLSSSSTSSLPSRNREYHLKTFDRFRASFP